MAESENNNNNGHISIQMNDNEENNENRKIAAISPKLPPFWAANPEIWFVQVEANFHVAKISADETKYYHVIACIESKHLEAVQDILKNPPITDKYKVLKERLIKEFSFSETEKLNQLLQTIELGDRKPSQLLREMQRLADKNVSAAALETLFLQRLPEKIKHIVTASSADIEEKAKIADRIYEMTGPQVSAIQAQNVAVKIPNWEERFQKKLADAVARLEVQNKGGRQRSRSRQKSPAGQKNEETYKEEDKEEVCFFHKKFGEKAYKCQKPCKFFKEN